MENEIYVKVLIPHCDCGEEYREYPTKIIVTKEENGYGIWFEYCPGGGTLSRGFPRKPSCEVLKTKRRKAMKCVTNGSDVKRVPNDVAMELTKGGWFYCPKALWKERTGRWSVDKAFSEMEKSAR